MKKKQDSQLRFDDHEHAFYEEKRLMDRSAKLTHQNFQATKKHAYRTAKAFIEMQAKDPNRLMQLIREKVKPGPDLVNRFIEQTFASLSSIGEDFSELITAIHEGMSESDYLKQSPTSFLSAKKSTSVPVRPGESLPPKPLDDMSAEEQVEHWRTRALAAEQDLRSLKTRVSELESEAKKLRNQNKKLHRLATSAAK